MNEYSLHLYYSQNLNKDVKPPSANAPATSNADMSGISAETHETMSTIFKLISNKSQSQAGIALLYEYKVSRQTTVKIIQSLHP